MKLSDNLKRIRKENDLSQEQLAEKLGVSRQAVSKWESDQSYPEMEKVLLICKLFNYNIDELMNENVKDVNEIKESKKNLNKSINDFFSFITKIVKMLESMSIKERLKCLFEQVVILCILFAIWGILGVILTSIFSEFLIGLVNSKVYHSIIKIITLVYNLLSLGIGISVFLHVFKLRYLDYFKLEIRGERIVENNLEITQEEQKIIKEKTKERIIFRDPENSRDKILIRLGFWYIRNC